MDYVLLLLVLFLCYFFQFKVFGCLNWSEFGSFKEDSSVKIFSNPNEQIQEDAFVSFSHRSVENDVFL